MRLLGSKGKSWFSLFYPALPLIVVQFKRFQSIISLDVVLLLESVIKCIVC